MLYGIERVYYQGLLYLAPCFVLGADKIAEKLRVKPFIFMLAFVIILGALNYTGGQIPSIKG